MNINQFNQLDDEQVTQLLSSCVNIPRWSDELKAKRPYSDVSALLSAAQAQVKTWQWQEVADALAKHPRIGEKAQQAHLNEKEQNFSENEQKQLNITETVQDALLKGNMAYEAQFGHIFLIRAAGRTSEEVLSELNRRMGNAVADEQKEVIDQLGQIALLRLEKEVRA